jgi:two-component system chemotaxis response regulator CheY
MSTAMVVDDSRTIRVILGRTLREMGWEVCEASNGREAMDVLGGRAQPPGLVLVDWNMPEMNGLEFVRSVRGDARYDATKLMMVTTETQVDQMMVALEAGANEYVMKPFTRDVIEDKLRLLGLAE